MSSGGDMRRLTRMHRHLGDVKMQPEMVLQGVNEIWWEMVGRCELPEIGALIPVLSSTFILSRASVKQV